MSKYKDAEIQWKFLRPSTAIQLKARRTTTTLSKVRAKAKLSCEEMLPKTGLTPGIKPAGVAGTGCASFPAGSGGGCRSRGRTRVARST